MKTVQSDSDSAPALLRAIPSMERILTAASFAPLIAQFGREGVKREVTQHLAELRPRGAAWDEATATAAVSAALARSHSSGLRRVINATGILIHTNLGRSPIDPAVWEEAAAFVTGYSNLEFDLDQGQRGARDTHLSELCRTLFGCEEAILTNNNAAGTMLLLAATSAGREVIVSRGELVEIGGAFRVPDVIQQGGAKLREVGTTNRTRAADYEAAATRRSAAILRVHRSNFEIVGFTETPSVEDLAAVATRKKLPLLIDEGSGCVVDLQRYGFAPKQTVRELLELGASAISCSTDKLIGATQGGLILGSREMIERCRRHPLMRALRVGKESYAVVAATLRTFAAGAFESRIPIYRMLATPLGELRQRATELSKGVAADIVESRCALGGGTTPTETIDSFAVALKGNAAELHARFLRADTPIVGRIQDDRLLLDMRTLSEADLPVVRAAMAR